MRIYHDSRAGGQFEFKGETYEPDDDGFLDVSHEVGEELTKQPWWHVYTGEPELSDEEIEDGISKRELRARVDELETELAALKAKKPARTKPTE